MPRQVYVKVCCIIKKYKSLAPLLRTKNFPIPGTKCTATFPCKFQNYIMKMIMVHYEILKVAHSFYLKIFYFE